MISKLKLLLLCPVPENQKPITEYIGLKENPLTKWTTLSTKNYNKKLLSFFVSISALWCLLTYDKEKFWGDWIIFDIFLTLNSLIVLFLIVIWRWNEVKKRLNQSRLFYEEASWYDGQVWEKPFTIIKNDRLLVTQKIEPILHRLTNNLCFLLYIDILFLILI